MYYYPSDLLRFEGYFIIIKCYLFVILCYVLTFFGFSVIVLDLKGVNAYNIKGENWS